MAQQEQKILISKFVDAAMKDKQQVNVFLQAGTRLHGFVGDYDPECIALYDNARSEGIPTIVMRSSVASITRDGGR